MVPYAGVEEMGVNNKDLGGLECKYILVMREMVGEVAEPVVALVNNKDLVELVYKCKQF